MLDFTSQETFGRPPFSTEFVLKSSQFRYITEWYDFIYKNIHTHITHKYLQFQYFFFFTGKDMLLAQLKIYSLILLFNF